MIPHGHPDADAVETDPAALKGSEDLDEDRPHVDPLEEGIETRYAHSGRFGTTRTKRPKGESLDGRLRQEPIRTPPGG